MQSPWPVYNIIEREKEKDIWNRCASAYLNRDNSMNLDIHYWPLNGKFTILVPKDLESPHRPEERFGVFHIVYLDNNKNIWNRVGTAWSHRRGGGLNVQLSRIPAKGEAKLHLRKPRENDRYDYSEDPAVLAFKEKIETEA